MVEEGDLPRPNLEDQFDGSMSRQGGDQSLMRADEAAELAVADEEIDA
jgi:hypothetical protein